MKKLSATQWIIVSMAIGVALGYFLPAADHPNFALAEKAISSVFLRMIKTLIVPLIFATLVVGIAGHGDDMKRVGRLAFRSIVYFEVVTTLALVIGLLAVNLVKPGVGVNIATTTAEQGAALANNSTTFMGVIEHTVPQSFFEAAATNQVLQVVFFAILFAVALARVPAGKKQPMLAFCDSLAEVMFKFTSIVMSFAPYGIGAAIALTVSSSGVGVLKNLAVLVATLYGACLVCLLLVYVPIAIFVRIPLRAFWNAIKEPSLIAFSTASSEAALPLAMERLEELGVPKRIVAFVLPTGYSFNLAGSTLYLAVASVFAAQAAGMNMPLQQQLLMMLTLMLTSKGVAGVPRAALVILSGALTMFGLPLQVVAVLLGVDAVLDMARTVVNVIGNCLAAAVMARWEGELPANVVEVTQ